MPAFRALLTVLLAWSLCFQAVASVSSSRCAHAAAGVKAPAGAPQRDAHAGHHGHHQAGTASPAKATAPTDCDCGCPCAGHCALPCPGISTTAQTGIVAFTTGLPAALAVAMRLTAAHGADLLRPPSIS